MNLQLTPIWGWPACESPLPSLSSHITTGGQWLSVLQYSPSTDADRTEYVSGPAVSNARGLLNDMGLRSPVVIHIFGICHCQPLSWAYNREGGGQNPATHELSTRRERAAEGAVSGQKGRGCDVKSEAGEGLLRGEDKRPSRRAWPSKATGVLSLGCRPQQGPRGITAWRCHI